MTPIAVATVGRVATASLDFPENRTAETEQTILETSAMPATRPLSLSHPPSSPFSCRRTLPSSQPAVHSFPPGPPLAFVFVLSGRCLQVLALRPVSSEMLWSGF